MLVTSTSGNCCSNVDAMNCRKPRVGWHSICRAALLAGMVLCGSVRADSAPAMVNANSSGSYLNANLEYLVDDSDSLTVEQVARDGKFIPTHGAMSLGVQSHPVWLRVSLQRAANVSSDWRLEYGVLNAEVVQFSVPDGKGGFDTQISGETMPFSARPFPYNKFLYAITLPDERPVVFYIRTFKTTGLHMVPLRIWQFEHWAKRALLEYLGDGLCLGVMLGLALYNLLLFVRLRDGIFLLYFMVVFSYILLAMNLLGFGSYGLWPTWFEMFKSRTPLIGIFWSVCGIVFSQALLDGPDLNPWIRRTLNTISTIYFFTTIAVLVGYPGFAATVGLVLPSIWFPLVVGLALYRAWQGSLSAIYYLIGYGPVLLGVSFFIASSQSILPVDAFVLSFFMIAGAWEAVLFSQALAERVNLLKREREAARQRSQEVETERIEFERKRAYTDELTGLANREGLRKDGDAWITSGIEPLVLVLNIDRFKAINDTLGFSVGDAVLIATGQRLAALPEVIVGRLHANQFCLICRQISHLDQLRLSIALAFREPLTVTGQLVDVTLSVGVVTTARARDDMARRMRNAEIALHAGRRNYTGWTHYTNEMESGHRTDLSLLSALRRAVEDNQLRLYLQPKVCMADGSINSAEALLRWQHPDRGLVAPDDFIPFAEQTGSIGHLTHWVLREAMRMTRVRRELGEPLQISVNLSVHDLRDSAFVDEMRKLVIATGAVPGDIRLEITESVVMDDPTVMLDVMRALNAEGFSLSVDDFGTGYSSLAYLQKMPVTELKIDRAFVAGTLVGTDAEALLDSIIGLGHRLGLSVVAEGAATEGEWNLLRGLGCDYLQGWVVAKAMPVIEFDQWISNNTPFVVGKPETAEPMHV